LADTADTADTVGMADMADMADFINKKDRFILSLHITDFLIILFSNPS
jgi:hypothetical protein